MSTGRLWAIAGSAAAALAVLVLILVFALPPAAPVAEPTPTATPTRTSTPTPSATPSPSPTPTPTPTQTTSEGPTPATCENTSTEEFQALMGQNGWVWWETLDRPIGVRPFSVFPGGEPDGQIVCRWGSSPDLATDNVIDLAWAPIDGYSAVTAMQVLEASGYTRIDSTDGSGHVTLTGGEPVGGAYLFTPFDVRWAPSTDELPHIKAPDDPR